jgi:metal-responsive CopG/Arc/MetJ family transcriptional regulator
MKSKDVPISVRIPKKMKDEFLEYCEDECMTITEAIKNLIRDELRAYRKEKRMMEELKEKQ